MKLVTTNEKAVIVSGHATSWRNRRHGSKSNRRGGDIGLYRFDIVFAETK